MHFRHILSRLIRIQPVAVVIAVYYAWKIDCSPASHLLEGVGAVALQAAAVILISARDGQSSIRIPLYCSISMTDFKFRINTI